MAFIKNIFLNVLSGASFTVAALLVAVAYSDRVHPADHPLLACAGMLMPVFLIANLLMLMLWLMVKWRRAWIPIAGFIIAFPATRTYLPLHLSSDPPAGAIKVMTYNVAHYNRGGQGEPSLDTIHEYVRRQNADIVCMQEDWSFMKDTTRYASLYPYNDTVHVSRPRSKYINALGIHTRYPIVAKERIRYDSEANGSAAFYLLIDGDTVLVINNHLESTHLSKDDRERYADIINGSMDREAATAKTRMLIGKLSTAMATRSRQAEAVHHYIESHRRYPIIVCGDFNDTPISYVRRTIANGLTDCFVESGNGLGISYNQRGFVFRIDHIMCSNHYGPHGCFVDSHITASDHYPVVCWLLKR